MYNESILTENEVIIGVKNFLESKGKTSKRRVIFEADASKKQQGIDLKVWMGNEKNRGNYYIIEAKGSVKSDGEPMKSAFHTNFRWAISQIILRVEVNSTRGNYNYGIAVPESEIPKCIKIIQKNWALEYLKIRLYGAYRDDDGKLFAKEYTPSKIYDKKEIYKHKRAVKKPATPNICQVLENAYRHIRSYIAR